uniref:Uncharacterized protein n=1 Tax=Leishmania guyanensis TaxID=5670 RepID=A0A1E1J462_LEIGU|nr:Hypothetical protein BN36_3051120 [Leishmania guyanensis]
MRLFGKTRPAYIRAQLPRRLGFDNERGKVEELAIHVKGGLVPVFHRTVVGENQESTVSNTVNQTPLQVSSACVSSVYTCATRKELEVVCVR